MADLTTQLWKFALNLYAAATGTIGAPVVVAYGRSTAQTGAVTTLATFTPGNDGTFLVGANVLVTTATTHSFGVSVAYTDEGGTGRTVFLGFDTPGGNTVASNAAVVNTNGAVPYAGQWLHVRAKGGSAITLATSGTFTTVTYNVDGAILQIV